MTNHAQHAIDEPIFAPVARFHQGRFGRMFRNIRPWDPGGGSEVENLDRIEKLAETVFKSGTAENPRIPAGYTFFGQFIDHDLTLDTTSSLDRLTDPERIHNFRTPRFDLDCVYGRGPKDQPYLYEGGGTKMVLGKGAVVNEVDLPRFGGTALIGDPRNDENIIVSQVHLQILRLHNAMFDRLKQQDKYKPEDRNKEAFAEAQRLTRWHYQWVVIHDFAEKICGLDLIHELLDQPFNKPAPEGQKPGKPKLKFYDFDDLPFMPIEFSVAGFRFGHSLVREKYQLNDVTAAPIFGKDDKDLSGGRILPAKHTIQWDKFVEFKGSAPPAASLKIDTTLAAPLMSLPDKVVDDAKKKLQNRSLAFRNILRGHRLGLPSGQAIARRMGIPKAKIVASAQELPLWVYILKEAEDFEKGEKLGPVGARIVGETLVGLLAGDAFSYFSVEPGWEPDPADGGRLFNLAKLLEIAGAPMTAADLPK